MSTTELQTEPQPEREVKRLPLVVEILPGQAGEGLVAVFEPGSYEDAELRQLCDQALARQDLSIEEQLILEDIRRQLDGGKLLAQGRELQGPALAAAALEETQAGEQYWYVAVRAIKPQEGGR